MTSSDFDTNIDRMNTHSIKWEALEDLYDIPSTEGIAMWVADMDFKAPQPVLDVLNESVAHGIYGYYGDQSSYKNAIVSWMERRHGWSVQPEWIFTTDGLVHGTACCVQAFTQPKDAVILFTPVYHAFARVLEANGRRVHESELKLEDGRYWLDLEALEASLQGDETMLIFCSPHNPGGRVWSVEEQQAVSDFCRKHSLLLISDEIHHDLVFDGSKHTPMPLAAPNSVQHLIMMTAASKTFNLAGAHTGNVIIQDPKLRARFSAFMTAGAIKPNTFGLIMTEAAYNDGEEWLEELLSYLSENRKVFDQGVNAIPGLKSMALEATYLAWVDFSGTGMSRDEFTKRVQEVAKIAPNHGPTFGTGGESFLRFNLACPRAVVEEAVERLAEAFSDLQ